MPTVSIYEDDVTAELGQVLKEYGSKQNLVKSFDELCFNFGLELDEVTSEYEMFRKERGTFKIYISHSDFHSQVTLSNQKTLSVNQPRRSSVLKSQRIVMISFAMKVS